VADGNNIDARIKLRGSKEFAADAAEDSHALEKLGDKAREAARKFRDLNRATSQSRVGIGFLSTTPRTAALGFGVLAGQTTRLTGTVLGLAEATATVAGGIGGAGAVGLTALGQVAATISLGGLKDLTGALGGNVTALKRLTPEARGLFAELSRGRKQLGATAQAGFLPGLLAGTQAAGRNLPVLDKVIGSTAREMGGLARSAGSLVGSKGFGRDFATIGARNVTIIDNLGHAGLHLAGAFKDVAVAAGPLALWLSREAEHGAAVTEQFIHAQRATGGLSRFFQRARTDLTLLGQSGGHLTHGLINLFGAHDVDGTKTLQSFERFTARFDQWTRDPRTQAGVGTALIHGLEANEGRLAAVIAETFVRAIPQVVTLFWNGFWQASAGGKAALGAGILWKSGLWKPLGKTLGEAAGIGGKGKGVAGEVAKGLGVRGSSPANPLWVAVVGGVSPGGPLGKAEQGKGWLSKIGGAAGAAARVAGPGIGAVGAAAGLSEAGKWFDDHVLSGGASAAARAAGDPVKNFAHALDHLIGGKPSGHRPAVPFVAGSHGGGGQVHIRTEVAPIIMDGQKVAEARVQHIIRENRRHGGA
jgi:hypothetical protein